MLLRRFLRPLPDLRRSRVTAPRLPSGTASSSWLARPVALALVLWAVSLAGGPATAALAAQQPDSLPAEAPTLESLLGLEGVDPRVLPLDEALALALEGNRELHSARLGLEEAEGQVTEAWGNLYPRIDFTGSWTRNISPPVTFLPEIFFDPDGSPDELIPVAFGLDNQWNSTVSLEQPLFQAQAFIGVGSAARFRALQDEEVRGRMHEIVTRVRQSYYQLLLADEQARLVSRSVERVVESLAETQALNRAGLTSDYDVLRLEVELANLQPRLRQAANEALRVERELVTELNLPEGTRIRPEGSLARMDLEDPGANVPEDRRLLELTGVEVPPAEDEEAFGELLTHALASSSSLQQAELNEELRHTELRLEQAEFLPRVSLFASYQVSAQQAGSPEFFGRSEQRGYGRLAGIEVTVPVFTGRQRLARVDQRQAALRSARVQTDLARDRLRDELRTVLDQVEEARLRARAQRLAVEQASRGYEIASAEYREGTNSRLELTDAEVALRESEFNYAEAVYDYLEARARLDELVGDVPGPAPRP